MASAEQLRDVGGMLRDLTTSYEEASDEEVTTLVLNGHTDRLADALVALSNAYGRLPEDFHSSLRRIRDRIHRLGMDANNTSSEPALLSANLDRGTSSAPRATVTAASNSITPEHASPQTMSILRNVLGKCAPLKPEELKDDNVMCSICQQTFMTSADPEIPLKLPCGHFCGSGCVLKWLNPLSQNAHNTCPICRKPIIQPSGPPAEELRWINHLREWEARGHLPTTWAVRAEYLYHRFCESIVLSIEQQSENVSSIEGDAENWLCSLQPLVTLIDFVTLRAFATFVNDQASNSCHLLDRLQDLETYDTLLTHLRNRDPRSDAFLDADETTYARLAGWHCRIRESRDHLIGRLERAVGLQ